MTQVSRIAFLLLVLSACHGSSPTTPVSITISPSTASIDIGGTQRFRATVSGAPDAEITWSLSGDGCANDACGWIDAAGNYSAPDDPPNPPTMTITATVQGNEAKSAAATVTITSRSNAGFSGRYALLFNGFEANDVAVAITGSIEVDGNGRVTGGTLDTNRTVGVQTMAITDGTYSFGADSRGRLNLNTPQGALVFRFAMNAPNPPNHTGRLICFQPGDASRITGSGVIKKQNPAAFAASAFNGEFASGFLGELGPRNPVNTVGRFTLEPSGAISAGLVDTNLAGVAYPAMPSTGNYAAISPTSGRGTAQLGFPSTFGDLHFSFYVVSAVEAFFLSTDARTDSIPILSGPMLKQADRPFTASSMAGPLAFNTTGLNAAGSDVTVGRFDANAVTRTVSGIFDNNAAGVVSSSTAFSGQYNVSIEGRGTLDVQVGGTTVRYVLYMVSSNTALLMQSEAVEAGWGSIEAQTGGPFTTASISGSYVVGTVTPAECGCTSTSGVVTLNGAAGTFAGARDKSKPDGLVPRDLWSGTFEIPAGTNGRGTLTAAVPSTESSAVYVVSPNKLLLVSTESGFNLSAIMVLEK